MSPNCHSSNLKSSINYPTSLIFKFSLKFYQYLFLLFNQIFPKGLRISPSAQVDVYPNFGLKRESFPQLET